MENKIILPNTYHNDSSERILCAAIWYRDNDVYPGQPKNVNHGYVMTGWRHGNVAQLHKAVTGVEKPSFICVNGFLTSYNRFVERAEGNTIAITAKQVKYNKPGEDLISEDLY